MNFNKPSPFEGFQAPRFSSVAGAALCIGLESAMWTTFYAVYAETIQIMDQTYLSELPVVGSAFSALDPDANASHIIAMLLATFSVGTPIFLWAEIFRQKILDDPQEWFSHPQNQIIAGFAALVLVLVIALEVVNLYTLIAREVSSGGFVATTDAGGLMTFLAANKGMAIGVSAVIAVINIILALFSVRALRALKSPAEA